MNFEITYFKQVRADGTEYFFPNVQEKGRWFFGLIPYSNQYYVVQPLPEKGDPYLTHIGEAQYQEPFNSLEHCKRITEKVVEEYKKNHLKSKIVSFQKIDP